MKKRIISIFLTVMIVLAMIPLGVVSVFAEETGAAAVFTDSNKGLTLTSGTYSITDDTTVTNSTAGGSAITIAENSEVTIIIPENMTLTVIGADGKGQTGGGAGIWLPATSTLNLLGKGTLIAKGGKAGNGTDGYEGGKYSPRFLQFIQDILNLIFTGEWDVLSAGGEGGAGGGGAGAGIGTPGADGLEGGYGGFAAYSKDSKEYFSDVDGKTGGDSVASKTMGTLNANGVVVDAEGGAAGQGGAPGKIGRLFYVITLTGAGGGGGGGGYAAPAIGNGGYSGAGGGGGGTSPYDENISSDHFTNYGGKGGKGGNNGADGQSSSIHDDIGGFAGSGGVEGAVGKAKTFTVNFVLNGGSGASPFNYTYGSENNLPVPTKASKSFNGWTYGDTSDERTFAAITSVDAGNKTFYANWTHAHKWSSKWQYNDDAHWHKCLNSGCTVTDITEMDGYALHTFENYKCTVCGEWDYEAILATRSTETEGWNEDVFGTYYVENHAIVIGVHQIGSRYYFFDRAGTQRNGFVEDDGRYFYFLELDKGTYTKSGEYLHGGYNYKGEVLHGGNIYNTAALGYALETEGWHTDENGKYYIFKGVRANGVITVDNTYYYFDENGYQASGFVEQGGRFYYFQSLKYGGKVYKGLVAHDGKNYDTTALGYAEGPEGWSEADGNRYYVTGGLKLTGRQNINNKLYLFDEDGVQLYGLQKVGPYIAYFLKNKYYDGCAYYGVVSTGGQTYDFTNGPIYVGE